MKRLGLKEGNLKITTASGSVIVKAVSNEFETSEGIIVIANGPWANKLIDEKDFQENKIWFKANIETTKEEVTKIDTFIKEIVGE